MAGFEQMLSRCPFVFYGLPKWLILFHKYGFL